MRPHDENGAIFTIVAVVMPVLLLLTAGGITTFTLYAGHRELQRAADQAALAGAAAVPPIDPLEIADEAPLPLPGTEAVFDELPVAPPRITDPVNDPRTVACTYGADGLGAEAAGLVDAFGDPDGFEPPLDPVTEAPAVTVCEDSRVYPRLQKGSAFDPVECTNAVVQHAASELNEPIGLDVLDPVTSTFQGVVDTVAQVPMRRVLPLAFTPRMRVDVYARLNPPLLRLVTGRDGGRMRAGATAYRRIKNAVVVPILPSQRLLIDTGLVDPIQVMTDPVNLNRALDTSQQQLTAVVEDVDARLSPVMGTFGEPCTGLLDNITRDLRDIYDPPAGEAPSARDVVEAIVSAQQTTAERVGGTQPDPNNPDALAGEAVLLIGVTVSELMGPVGATQIPILDVALVVMNETSEGHYEAAAVSAANAYGAFRATLVE